MSRGYPDFFGYSSFPWYGDIAQSLQSVAVNIGATETLLTVLGKSIIYQGFVEVIGTVTHLDDKAYLDIDGVEASALTWRKDSLRLGGYSIPTEPLLIEVNETTFVYTAYFSGVFSVGVSVGLRYLNNSLENRNVAGAFTYSPIK